MRQGIVLLVRVIKPYQLGIYGIGGGLTVCSFLSVIIYSTVVPPQYTVFFIFLGDVSKGLIQKAKKGHLKTPCVSICHRHPSYTDDPKHSLTRTGRVYRTCTTSS